MGGARARGPTVERPGTVEVDGGDGPSGGGVSGGSTEGTLVA